MEIKLLMLLITVFIEKPVSCAKILVIAPIPAHSHFTVNFRLAKELADRNHEVTVINPYPQKHPIKNYRDVPVTEAIEEMEALKKNLLGMQNLGFFEVMYNFMEMSFSISEFTLKHPNVQTLLKSGEKFDLIITEYFGNDAYCGIAALYNAPIILLNALRPNGLINHLVANPAPSSYVPNLLGTLTKTMTFWERLLNLLVNNYLNAQRGFTFYPKYRDIVRKYISPDINLDDVVRNNISLMLSNSHPSINDPVPIVPAIIEIGGYHVTPPKKLPGDLQSFLDNAKDGVILFSMGSNLKSKDLDPKVRKAVLSSFGKIKQQVLWKFEAELPEAPGNVKVLPWIPQSDVLAHPNVRAFITHGGLLGSIEAIYHGVPMIGIPVFGDQKSNIARAVENGYAVALPLPEITEETFDQALASILHNNKFTENVKHRSKLMHDQPLKPIDRAVYWVEHVIRYKGAPHLRSAALDLTWYQREMIDIFAFLTVVLLSACIILLVAIRKFMGLFSNKAKVSNTKKNK